jgi:hypothetical protein
MGTRLWAARGGALGYKGDDTPCTTTFHLIFKDLDCQALDIAVGTWADGLLSQAETGLIAWAQSAVPG